jgi:hypothetical protein
MPFFRYMADNLGSPSRFLTWLRYTAFIPMYPLGLATEVICIWLAVPHVATSGRLSLDLPNPTNMAFHYSTFLRALLVIQPITWACLYSTLLRQRAVKLSSTLASTCSRNHGTPPTPALEQTAIVHDRWDKRSSRLSEETLIVATARPSVACGCGPPNGAHHRAGKGRQHGAEGTTAIVCW